VVSLSFGEGREGEADADKAIAAEIINNIK
jgi:hypothetical protein